MSNNDFQIIYQADPNNKYKVLFWEDEVKALRDIGFNVKTTPDKSAKRLLYRGSSHIVKGLYEKDNRFINKYQNLEAYLYMSIYYPYISDLTIDTFFVDELNEQTKLLIKNKGWNKAFIKKDSHALEHIDIGKSVFPNASFEEMNYWYDKLQVKGKYAIRKFISSREIIEQDERYWVINGNIYHRNNDIPVVVKEASKRLNKLGSSYYTIDATPNFIIEVNPGESSDRHGVNSAELFASWIKKEFG